MVLRGISFCAKVAMIINISMLFVKALFKAVVLFNQLMNLVVCVRILSKVCVSVSLLQIHYALSHFVTLWFIELH